jgi:hypothetical protein
MVTIEKVQKSTSAADKATVQSTVVYPTEKDPALTKYTWMKERKYTWLAPEMKYQFTYKSKILVSFTCLELYTFSVPFYSSVFYGSCIGGSRNQCDSRSKHVPSLDTFGPRSDT